MNKRKLKKAAKRLAYLPAGGDIFPWTANKAKAFFLKRRKSTRVARPGTLMLEVTNRCNLHCITCPREYRHGKEMDLGHMDFDLLKSIVDQGTPYLDSIGLTGLGEPLLHKQLPEALEYIKSKNRGIITSISSNMMLKNTPEIIEALAGNLDTLQISADGIGKTYDKIRENGDFTVFDSNLRKTAPILRKAGTDMLLNTVVIKENYRQMKDIYLYAADIGAAYINFTFLNLAGIPDIPVEYYEFYKSPEFTEKFQELKALASSNSEPEVSFWGEPGEYDFQSCNAPWGHFYITFDGFLVPCCGKPFPKEKHFGNLNEISLIDALNSKEFQDFRKLWQSNTPPKFCEKCNYVAG